MNGPLLALIGAVVVILVVAAADIHFSGDDGRPQNYGGGDGPGGR